jgi:ATPase complex subunit ATP10
MSSRRLELTAVGLARRSLTCVYCQGRRSFTATSIRAARREAPGTGASLDPKSEISGPAIEAPRSYGKKMEGEFTPKPLPRPIGLPLPPQAGENTGIDTRTRAQRKEDFSNYEKHIERRKEL